MTGSAGGSASRRWVTDVRAGAWWAVLWSVWGVALVVVLVLGAVAEAVALISRRYGDTLSEHVWRWAGVVYRGPEDWNRRRVAVLIGGTVGTAFAAWLTVHLVWGV